MDGNSCRDIKTITNPTSNYLNKIDDIRLDTIEKVRYLRIYIRKRNANAFNNVSIREIRVIGREKIVSNSGEISNSNINDKKVSILLEVYKVNDETNTATKNIVVTVPGKASLNPEVFPSVTNANKEPKVIPSLQEWYGLNGNFKLIKDSRILINDGSNVDLRKVATLFNRDLKDFTGMELQVIEA